MKQESSQQFKGNFEVNVISKFEDGGDFKFQIEGDKKILLVREYRANRIGFSSSPSEAVRHLLEAANIHRHLREIGVLNSGNVVPTDYWGTEASGELKIDLKRFIDENSAVIPLPEERAYSFAFLRMIGQNPKIGDGNIDFHPVPGIGKLANECLRTVIQQSDFQNDTIGFLGALEKGLIVPDLVLDSQVSEALSPDIASPDVSVESKNGVSPTPVRRKSRQKKLTISILFLLILSVVAFGAFHFLPSFSPRVVEYETLDEAGLRSLFVNTDSEEKKNRIHEVAVKKFGQGDFWLLNQPLNAHPDVRATVVPRSHSSIQEAIDAAGSKVIYICPMEKPYDESIKLKPGVTIEGLSDPTNNYEVVIKADGKSMQPLIEIASCQRVTLRNLVLDGNRTERPQVTSAVIRSSDTAVNLDSCTIRDSPGIGILIEGSFGSVDELSNLIGTSILNSKQEGVVVAAGGRLLVIASGIQDNGGSGIVADGIDTYLIIDSQGDSTKSNSSNNGGAGIEYKGASKGSLNGVTCLHNGSDGIRIVDFSPLGEITDVDLQHNGGNGILIKHAGIAGDQKNNEIGAIRSVTASNNEGCGILLQGLLADLELAEVTVESNKLNGILFQWIEIDHAIEDYDIPKHLIVSQASKILSPKREAITVMGPGRLTLRNSIVTSNGSYALRVLKAGEADVQTSTLKSKEGLPSAHKSDDSSLTESP